MGSVAGCALSGGVSECAESGVVRGSQQFGDVTSHGTRSCLTAWSVGVGSSHRPVVMTNDRVILRTLGIQESSHG